MNELQKVEFEILKQVIDVCKKYNLRYYLVCGSALGAVKYKGFIPWDDDIDIALPRDDYERFVILAADELDEHLFVQNIHTEPNFPYMYTKIRNSRTAYFESNTAHLNINHGVFIDVFPLDGYPIGKLKASLFELRKKLFTWRWMCALTGQREGFSKIHYNFFRFLGCHKNIRPTVLKYNKFLSRYKLSDSSVWCNHGNGQGIVEYSPREHYGDGVSAFFEGVEVIIPQNYNQYLSQKYRDWRADLPLNQQKGHHYFEIVDLHNSYKKYIKSVSDDGKTISLDSDT